MSRIVKLVVLFHLMIGSLSQNFEGSKNVSQDENSEILERHKRQLLYPVATLLQFSACVASPIQLRDYIFFMNHGFQLNFQLPNRLSQLPNSFLAAVPVIEVARSREKREEQPVPDVTSDLFYYMLSQLIDTYGYNGTGCLLHTICELGKQPFHKDEDLLHEVVHFILTPSEHDMPANFTQPIIAAHQAKYPNKINITSFDTFLRAEAFGKSGGDCASEYRYCPESPLDFLSELIHEDVDEDDGEEDERVEDDD